MSIWASAVAGVGVLIPRDKICGVFSLNGTDDYEQELDKLIVPFGFTFRGVGCCQDELDDVLIGPNILSWFNTVESKDTPVAVTNEQIADLRKVATFFGVEADIKFWVCSYIG